MTETPDLSQLTHAVTLHQPYATKLLLPLAPPTKRVEFRSWPLPARYVGVPLAVHSSRRRLSWRNEFPWLHTLHVARFNYGAVLGAAVFGEPIAFQMEARVVSTISTESPVMWHDRPWFAREFGYPSVSAEWPPPVWYAWPLLRVADLCYEVVLCRGARRIWRMDDEIRERVQLLLRGRPWTEVNAP